MLDFDLNLWTVLVAGLVQMVLGALWYSPAFFGKMWMHYMGLTAEHMEKHKKDMWSKYALNFLAALLMSYILAHFVYYTESRTFSDGMQTGFWLWLGFIATTFLGSLLWEMKKVQLYYINVGYYLVTLLLTGGLLAVWQ